MNGEAVSEADGAAPAARRVSALCLREEESAWPLPMEAAAADTEQPGWTRPRPHDSPGAGQLQQFGSGWLRRRRSVMPHTTAGAASYSPGEQTTGQHGSLATSPWLHRAAGLLFAIGFSSLVMDTWISEKDWSRWPTALSVGGGMLAMILTLHAALFQIVVVHREHCMSILHELADSGRLRPLERTAWLFFALVQCCLLSFSFALGRTTMGLYPLIILAVPVVVGGLSIMWGLMLGHAACIQSVKSHLLRLLDSLEDEERYLDSHAAGSSSLKQLKSLAVVHAHLMKRTKSMLGLSVSVGLFVCIFLGYFVFGMSEDLIVRGLAIIIGVCAMLFLRCLAKPGDEYKDMVLHLREFRLQSSAPTAKIAKHLLNYFEGTTSAITHKAQPTLRALLVTCLAWG